MKSIGIITIYGLSNYGNRLQNYALQKALEKHNCIVHTVGNWGGAYLYKSHIKILLQPFLPGILRQEAKRSRSFDQFTNKNILCDYFFNSSKEKKYDYYVCGSDQIWHPHAGLSEMYFARFAPKRKRISYAASIGLSEVSDDVASHIAEFVDEMEGGVSVREEAGLKIIKQRLPEKDVALVVDPTLLIDSDEWEKIAQKPEFPIPEHYALSYFLSSGDLEYRDKYIQKTVEENDLGLISLIEKDRNDFWFKTGPAEFLWLIKNADIIFTDSFHGTVFSMLMKKPFIVFDRGSGKKFSMASRIDTLLGMFGQTERHFDNISKVKNIFEIDYSDFDRVVDEKRLIAHKFLSDALEE